MSEHIVAGIVGGFVATIVMGAFMMAMMRGQPMPTQIFASKFLNDKPPERNTAWGMILHFVYGTVMGLVFAVIVDAVWDVTDLGLGTLAGYGAAWGVVLFMIAQGRMMILGMMAKMKDAPVSEKMKMMGGFLGMHLLYGVILGAVVAWMVG